MPAKTYTLYRIDCHDGIPRYMASRREATRVVRDIAAHGGTAHLYKVLSRNLSGLTMVLLMLNGQGWVKEAKWISGYEEGERATEEDALARREAAEEARKERQEGCPRDGYVKTYGPEQGRGYLREVRRKAGNRSTPPPPAFKRW